MRTDFSLRDLEIFHAIATTGSTRQAALKLQMTQSAVSHALARLEGTLQIQLFMRGKQRLLITTAGRYMLNEAVQIQSDMVRARGEVLASRAKSSTEYLGKLVADGAKTAQDNFSKIYTKTA